MSERQLDQQLVERVQKGDKRAFDLLVGKYQHKVMSLISRFVHDADEVQDVAQEAFIKAYKALPRFRGDSAFYTWLYRIAVNTAKNHLASRSRRPPSFDVEAEDAEFMDAADGLRDVATPEAQAFTSQLGEALKGALEALPEDLRTAVMLREFDGLSYEEIADIMDCPIGTVRSRIFRGREALSAVVNPMMQGL